MTSGRRKLDVVLMAVELLLGGLGPGDSCRGAAVGVADREGELDASVCGQRFERRRNLADIDVLLTVVPIEGDDLTLHLSA